MSTDRLLRSAMFQAPSAAVVAAAPAAPIVGLAALALIAIVFVVLAWRYSSHERPFELRCGVFRLRSGPQPEDTS